MTAPVFVRSSFCQNGTCVEAALLPDGSVALRDAKHPERPAHVFDRAEWTAFLAGVRNREFDFGLA